MLPGQGQAGLGEAVILTCWDGRCLNVSEMPRVAAGLGLEWGQQLQEGRHLWVAPCLHSPIA